MLMNHAETAGPNLLQHSAKLDDLPLPNIPTAVSMFFTFSITRLFVWQYNYHQVFKVFL